MVIQVVLRRDRACATVTPVACGLSLCVMHLVQILSNGATIVDGGMIVQDNDNNANTITVVNSASPFAKSVIDSK
jgi:hypothetical protein